MDQQPRPIIVAGASTGTGNHLTRRLAELGHPVFATARKPAFVSDSGDNLTAGGAGDMPACLAPGAHSRGR